MTGIRKAYRHVCRKDGCPLQGQVHPRCTAHRNKIKPPAPCGRPPVKGSNVCPLHGGATTLAKRIAAERVAKQEATKVIRRLFPDPHDPQLVQIDPTKALLDLISWKYAEVMALRERVTRMDEADLAFGTTSEVDKDSGQFPGTDTTRSAAPNVWWTMLRGAEDQLKEFSAAAHRAGIADQQIRMAQGQVQLAMDVIREALNLALVAVTRLLEAGVADQVRSVWPELVQGIIVEAVQNRVEAAKRLDGPAAGATS